MAKLIMTVAEMSDRENWLKMRGSGIGGSDAAVIAGVSSWKSPFQLWLEKTGQVEAEDLSDNEYVYWGTVLEQAVADRFCELTGKKVTRRGMLQDEKHPFLLASVDRMVVGENAGLECKTTNSFSGKAWEDDEIPDAYYIQCQHYMMVTGCEKWYIACLIGGNHFVWKEVARNEADIEALRELEIRFWDMVKTGTMPEVDGSKDCANALSERYKAQADLSVEMTTAARDALSLYKDLKQHKKEVEQQMALYENQLKAMLGEAEVGLLDGAKAVTWKQQAGRITVDSNKLKSEYPAAYEACKKVGNPTRTFRIA